MGASFGLGKGFEQAQDLNQRPCLAAAADRPAINPQCDSANKKPGDGSLQIEKKGSPGRYGDSRRPPPLQDSGEPKGKSCAM